MSLIAPPPQVRFAVPPISAKVRLAGGAAVGGGFVGCVSPPPVTGVEVGCGEAGDAVGAAVTVAVDDGVDCGA